MAKKKSKANNRNRGGRSTVGSIGKNYKAANRNADQALAREKEAAPLPEEFVRRMRAQMGEEAEEFLASFETEGRPSLRLNPMKQTKAVLEYIRSAQQAESASGDDLRREDSFYVEEPVAWEAYGRYYDEEAAPGKHPLHAAGAYYIQEASAMAPVRYLDPKPGEWVLDLCAAPGGKTSQIGALMQNQGLLVCNEIVPKRAQILSENMERMGLSNVLVVSENPLDLQNHFPGCFDRILVDAPCSGEGMFRKHPQVRTEWSEENVRICAERQDEILDCAANMLAPGGRIVFSTCTFAPLEDEGSVTRFLERHPEYMPVADLKLYEGMTSPMEGTVRLWPHKLKGEGHFLAVLQKQGGAPRAGDDQSPIADPVISSRKYRSPLGGMQSASKVDNKSLEALREFLHATLKPEWAEKLSDSDRFLMFGEQLYFMPEHLPNLKGIKVMRPGLHLGTIRKERFEPSHALALALPEGAVICAFPVTQQMAGEYLKGMTLSGDRQMPQGWYRVEYLGLGLGWGKFAGGILKNHYPKGLRILS